MSTAPNMPFFKPHPDDNAWSWIAGYFDSGKEACHHCEMRGYDRDPEDGIYREVCRALVRRRAPTECPAFREADDNSPTGFV